jgi:ribonuclease HI
MKQIITVFTDGGARGNPGPAACGIAISGIAGKERLLCGKYLGVTTNNVAEYSAFLLAYETLLDQDGLIPEETEIEFFADSLLAVKQLNGEYRIKNPNLANFINQIKNQEKLFAKVTYQHVRREFNKAADGEVNRVLDHETGKKKSNIGN